MAWTFQYAAAISIGSIFAQFPNIFIGSGWLFIFIAEDIMQDVALFNIIVKTPPKKDGKRTKLANRFCDIVQIHMDGKQ